MPDECRIPHQIIGKKHQQSVTKAWANDRKSDGKMQSETRRSLCHLQISDEIWGFPVSAKRKGYIETSWRRHLHPSPADRIVHLHTSYSATDVSLYRWRFTSATDALFSRLSQANCLHHIFFVTSSLRMRFTSLFILNVNIFRNIHP